MEIEIAATVTFKTRGTEDYSPEVYLFGQKMIFDSVFTKCPISISFAISD